MSVLKDRMSDDVLEQLESLRWTPTRDPAAQARGRTSFLALAESLGQGVSPNPVQRLLGWLESVTIQAKARHPMLTTVTAILLALAVSFGGAGATAYAAQAALPGDLLYPVKVGLEDAQVALSMNEAAGAQLHLDFAQNRMEETIALIAQGRYGDVHAAADRLESGAHQATEAFGAVAQVDPDYARALAESLDTGLARHAQVLSNLLVTLPDLPDEARPGILRAVQVCEASRQRARDRMRLQWRTEQPHDGPPGPPDGVPLGSPEGVAPGPPDGVPLGPPDGVPPVDVLPVDVLPVDVPPVDVPPGPADDARRGLDDDALQYPPSGTHRGSSGWNR